ncbi:MAG: hypothetical protein KIS77_10930 [Saprospiraceae bacterium]|nr:hypothetical protein [Saprospiraceae bacterium]
MTTFQNVESGLCVSEFQGADFDMLFEKIIEMRHFRKTERIRNFRHIPVAVPQHDFRGKMKKFKRKAVKGF